MKIYDFRGSIMLPHENLQTDELDTLIYRQMKHAEYFVSVDEILGIEDVSDEEL